MTRRVPSLSFQTLKRLSFAHSAVYCCLLICWIVPGLATGEFVFGLAHGVGWIAMCLLCFAALGARVIPMHLAVAVTVLGGIGPFIGTYAFIREEGRGSRQGTLQQS